MESLSLIPSRLPPPPPLLSFTDSLKLIAAVRNDGPPPLLLPGMILVGDEEFSGAGS